ncbi:hypothetical protein DFH11DRAFT_1545009 [Phellopilus nigrolimitatus]|nr:hypothetical protein DFH11DRAFT_1545009 [Phellopilus nigrolimitatus]
MAASYSQAIEGASEALRRLDRARPQQRASGHWGSRVATSARGAIVYAHLHPACMQELGPPSAAHSIGLPARTPAVPSYGAPTGNAISNPSALQQSSPHHYNTSPHPVPVSAAMPRANTGYDVSGQGDYRYDSQTSRRATAQGYGPGAHVGQAPAYVQPPSTEFTHGAWSGHGVAQGQPPSQAAPPAVVGYPYQTSNVYSPHQSPTHGYSHAAAGQPHDEPLQTFPGGAYVVADGTVYQTPHGGQMQHVASQYPSGSGQGYNHPISPSSANADMYYQRNTHQQ